jgi:hypothetical protein
MRKYIVEILDEVNKEPTALAKYREDAALKFVFQYAFIPEQKFDLPEGEPPFKPDPAPIGMTPTNFTQEVRKFYVFTKARQLPKLRREQLFIQLLESVHPSEAKLLVAIKDQKLNKLYKNVTAKLAAEYGFIPVQTKKNEDTTPKKS